MGSVTGNWSPPGPAGAWWKRSRPNGLGPEMNRTIMLLPVRSGIPLPRFRATAVNGTSAAGRSQTSSITRREPTYSFRVGPGRLLLCQRASNGGLCHSRMAMLFRMPLTHCRHRCRPAVTAFLPPSAKPSPPPPGCRSREPACIRGRGGAHLACPA